MFDFAINIIKQIAPFFLKLKCAIIVYKRVNIISLILGRKFLFSIGFLIFIIHCLQFTDYVTRWGICCFINFCFYLIHQSTTLMQKFLLASYHLKRISYQQFVFHYFTGLLINLIFYAFYGHFSLKR